MLEADSAILDAARAVTRVLRESRIRGAIIGGVAVGLHGHVRATLDVDVLAPEPLAVLDAALRAAGCDFNRRRREFVWHDVPIHLVTEAQAGRSAQRLTTIDKVLTVSLADLVNIKLRSGLRSLVRAQDLADVIGLIRARRLTAAFAARIDRDLRGDFRRLVRAVRAAD